MRRKTNQITLPIGEGQVYNLYSGVDPRFIGQVQARAGTTDDQAFLDYHCNHPEVLQGLVRLARSLKGKKVSIRMLWEVLRWEHLSSEGPTSNPLRLNDRWHSRYVRLICSTQPDLKSMFTTRSLKT